MWFPAKTHAVPGAHEKKAVTLDGKRNGIAVRTSSNRISAIESMPWSIDGRKIAARRI
jgi:hypothetical protein